MDGMIFNIQPFSVYDGPGLRTVVFMKGCNLKCFWCHNPESQSITPELMFYSHKCIGCGACAVHCPEAKNSKATVFSQICNNCFKCVPECYSEAITISGRSINEEELIQILLKDKAVFERTGGGVTFSGGEPLLQSEFVFNIMQTCKKHGIHTAIETALCVSWNIIEPLLTVCDLWICDLKSMDSEKHKAATGADNSLILSNLQKLSEKLFDSNTKPTNSKLFIRTPVIPDFNDTREDIEKIAEFIKSLDTPVEFELLPFHGICETKYTALNRDYQAKNLTEPDSDTINRLYEIYANFINL